MTRGAERDLTARLKEDHRPMASLSIKRMETDVLIIGAGGAGCFAAMKAADLGAKVIVLNKVPWLGGTR